MSLLRRTRTEMAGAWRSLRYDLGRATARPPGDGPDVTSTGMGTWGLPGLVDQAEPVPARRPRRAVAMTALGTLSVVGAAAAYLAMVNGLGSLMAQSPAAADAVAPRVAVTSAARMGSPAPAGRVATATPPARPRPVRPPVRPSVTRAAPPAPATLAVKVPDGPPQATTAPIRTAGPKRTAKPASPECHCRVPVPTPTAPQSPPSAKPSTSGSSSPDPSPSESAEPSGSPSPSRSWDGERHRRHH